MLWGAPAMKLQWFPSFESGFQAEVPILEPQLSYTAAALQTHLCLDTYPTDRNPDPTHGFIFLIWTPSCLASMDLPGRHWTVADPEPSWLIKTLNCLNPQSYHYGFVWWPGLLAVSRHDLLLLMSCGTFPWLVEKATTFASLSVTPGYWFSLTEKPALALPDWCLTIGSNWVLG